MNKYEVVYTALQASSDVTDLVGDQVYPVLAPQGTKLPYVVIRTSGSESPITKNQTPTHEIRYFMDVTAYGRTLDAVTDIAVACRRALDGYMDRPNQVGYIRYVSEEDDYIFEANTFYVTVTFSVPLGNQ